VFVNLLIIRGAASVSHFTLENAFKVGSGKKGECRMLLLFSPLSFLGTRNFSELTAVSKDQRKKEEISSSSAGSPRHFKQFYRGGKKKLNLHHEIASIPFFPTSLLLLETYNIVESSVITRKLLAA